MATIRPPSLSFLSAFLPAAHARLFPLVRPPQLQYQLSALLQHFRLHSSVVLPAVLIPIPQALGELWNGILEAVPKKKTSHMKKRHRQMAGKALKDITALNKCSACGRLKRAHVLCPYCVNSIKQWFGNGFKTKEEVDMAKKETFNEHNKNRLDRGQDPLDWDTIHGKNEANKSVP